MMIRVRFMRSSNPKFYTHLELTSVTDQDQDSRIKMAPSRISHAHAAGYVLIEETSINTEACFSPVHRNK
jgi:hypothetical protein